MTIEEQWKESGSGDVASPWPGRTPTGSTPSSSLPGSWAVDSQRPLGVSRWDAELLGP